jgi:hypothetical protein
MRLGSGSVANADWCRATSALPVESATRTFAELLIDCEENRTLRNLPQVEAVETMMRGVIAIASAVVLSACTSDQAHPTVTPSTALPAPFIRECGSAAFGEPNMKNEVTIGPLVLVGIPQAAVESVVCSDA